MGLAFQTSQWVIVTNKPYGFGIADIIDDLDATSRLLNAESLSVEDHLVTFGVQFGESLAELELFTIDTKGAVGAFLTFNGVGWQRVAVDAEEITHSSLFQFQVTGHAVVCGHVYDVCLHLAEDPTQHVVEMHADIGGHAATFVDVAFPGGIIPVAS